MDTNAASRTAVLVCRGRAVAHGRMAVGRFDDPTALALLRGDERAAVERVRSGVVPDGWAARMDHEMLTANAEVMVPRTVAIDDAVRTSASAQLVILGAGLDGRAWRMPELATVDVFEVDHPASQRDKRDRAQGLRLLARSLRFVPVDFVEGTLAAALDQAGHQTAQATTWVWEGVVSYLTRAEVEATARVVGDRSAPGSRLVVNYQQPSLAARVGRLLMRGLAIVARRPDPLAREPWRSLWRPAAMSALLARHGLRVVSDDDLLTFARGLDFPVRHTHSLRTGRVAVADRPPDG